MVSNFMHEYLLFCFCCFFLIKQYLFNLATSGGFQFFIECVCEGFFIYAYQRLQLTQKNMTQIDHIVYIVIFFFRVRCLIAIDFVSRLLATEVQDLAQTKTIYSWPES